METTKEKELPDTLHELLEIALGDLRKCEADDMYDIDMAYWFTECNVGHVGEEKTICKVCLAGSVMAQTMGLYGYPSSQRVGHETHYKFEAIDDLRGGRVNDAKSRILNDGLPCTLHGDERPYKDFNPTSYYVDSDKFFEDMHEILEYLKQEEI